jgi:hypothetical protein
MAPRSLFTVLGLAAATAIAAPASTPTQPHLAARSVISHDAVVGFAETVPSGDLGTLYLKYKPYLEVINGCVPFPAVDAAGNTGSVKHSSPSLYLALPILTSVPRFSGGLKPTGGSSSGCSSSTGQVYARAMAYNSYWAIMYSWYMPKDEPSTGIGHRHDWENCVVFLSSESTSASVVGMSVSQHSGYSSSTSPSFSGNNPLVGYVSYWPIDHQLIFDSTQGGMQPLIAWESLTTAAQNALQTTDFGDANVPFKDDNFSSKVAAAASDLGI